jgi:hypothetical protein
MGLRLVRCGLVGMIVVGLGMYERSLYSMIIYGVLYLFPRL